jgi:surface-anchored protein
MVALRMKTQNDCNKELTDFPAAVNSASLLATATQQQNYKKTKSMTSIHRNIATLCLASLAALPASAALYTKGHGDLGIAYDAGLWDLHVHLHQFAVVDGITLGADTEYAPGDITIAVPNPSVARPGSSTWAPLGISAGQPFWFLPAVQDVNKPFVGFGAEELDPLDWTGNISLKMTGISGSGVTAGGFMSMWDTDVFGDKTFHWTSANGIDGTDVYELLPGSHGHGNYAFTKAGTYDVTIEAIATHVTDGVIVGSATYHFEVAPVPEPATTFTGLACIGIAALRRNRARMRR